MFKRWLFPGLALVIAVTLFAAMSAVVQAETPTLSEPPDPGRNIEALEPNDVTGTCVDGIQDSGAEYRICMPSGFDQPWNGDLVVYAHGYVPFYADVGIPESQMSLPGSPYTVDQIVNFLGYGFATTSYYTNGLAVRPALSDLLDLVDIFVAEHGSPGLTLLTGVSEGGLITTLATENYPDVFDGGLAMCGPGDFNRQISHYGDFRVIFDYFFPGLMPGEPITIPTSLIETWETSYYSETILPVITNTTNTSQINQLLQVTDVAPYAFDLPTSTNSIERLLWYNVYATMDGWAKLGGQPYSNLNRIYSGSDDDTALNAAVWRTSADPAALAEIERYYDPTGVLTSPLVTLHNTGDFLVPYDHVALYRAKVMQADNLAMHRHFKVERYGHCAFEESEIVDAFNALVDMVEYPPPYQPVQYIYMPLILHTR
jgi:pimeloyl-ACP methyl ester carboxylesterase